MLLAHSPNETIEIILNEELEAYTEYTHTNPIMLRQEIEEVRQKGFAFSKDELKIGNYSIAAPVYNYENEVVCAITLVGPTSRLTDVKKERFSRLLVAAAKEASERLGYDGY